MSRKPAYTTLGKGKSSSKNAFSGNSNMLVPWRVCSFLAARSDVPQNNFTMRRTRNLLSSSHLFHPFSTLHPAPGKPLGSRDPTAKWVHRPPFWLIFRRGTQIAECFWIFETPEMDQKNTKEKHLSWKKIWHGCSYISVTKKSCLCRRNLDMLIGCSLFSQSSHPWLCSVERQDKDFNHVTQQRSITGYKQNIKISMYILFIKITYELSHTSVNYNCIWYIYSGYANRDRLKVPLLKSTTAPQLHSSQPKGLMVRPSITA